MMRTTPEDDSHRDDRRSVPLPGLDGPEPPAALDAAILAAARAAVREEAEPRVVELPRRRHARWIAPLSLAASLLLAVGVGWQLHLAESEAPERAAVVPQRAAVPAPAAAPLVTDRARAKTREERAAAAPSVAAETAAPARAERPGERVAERVPSLAAAPPAAPQADAVMPGPEAELGEIRRLVEERQQALAVERLKRFKARWPAEPVPADLAGLLPEDER